MRQDIKHGMIATAYYISFLFASLYFLKLAESIDNAIISNIVGFLCTLFFLFCLACLLLLSHELQKAKETEMYENEFRYYANLYHEEVIKHGKEK